MDVVKANWEGKAQHELQDVTNPGAAVLAVANDDFNFLMWDRRSCFTKRCGKSASQKTHRKQSSATTQSLLPKHFPNRQLSCSASRLRVWTPQSRQLILKQVKEGLHCHAGIQVSFLIGWKKQAVIASLLNTRLHKLALRPKRQQLYCISFCINDLNLSLLF